MNSQDPITRAYIEGLPRWARVALAARSVRRVQPLFRQFWPNAPREMLAAINRAVTVAERSAANARPVDELGDAAAAAALSEQAAAGMTQVRPPGTAPLAVPNAVGIPWATARAAAAAAQAALDGTPETAFRAVFSADIAAVDARAMDIVSGIRQDLDRLQIMSTREGWKDETPVGPEFFELGPTNSSEPADRALHRELETYRRKLPDLLDREGQFVLIHAHSVEGVWETYREAIDAGYKRFGPGPFLVHRIQAVERPVRLG